MQNLISKTAIALSTLLVVTTLAGCTEEATGTPTPATTAVPSSASGQPSPAPTGTSGSPLSAPQVKQPLKADKFIANPCLSLDENQAQSFKINGPGQVDQTIAPGCLWRAGGDSSVSISVTFMTVVKNGLSNLYNQKAAGWYKNGYFEESEISGYPAVLNDSSDRRPAGSCVLSVGITDQLFFSVLIQARAGDNVCKAANNVAEATLKTIRENQ